VCVTCNIEIIILHSLLLPITEEVRERTSERTISAYVLCYSKFHQEVNAFDKALTEWSLTKPLKQLQRERKGKITLYCFYNAFNIIIVIIQLICKTSIQHMAVEGGLLLQAFLLFCRLLITFDFKSLSLRLFIIYYYIKSDQGEAIKL